MAALGRRWSRRYVSEEVRRGVENVRLRRGRHSDSGRRKTKPLLKRAVLGLALWQHAWVDRHLAKLVEATRQESANDHSDDEDPLGSARRLSEVLRAQRDARRSALRSAATLALAVGDALDSKAWQASQNEIEEIIRTLGVLDDESWLAPPLWLALPLVAAVVVRSRILPRCCGRRALEPSPQISRKCVPWMRGTVGAFGGFSGNTTVRLLWPVSAGRVPFERKNEPPASLPKKAWNCSRVALVM